YRDMVAAFRRGLNEAGYIEGQNVAIEYRWADGHNDRLPALAADLVRRQVAAIVVNGPAAVVAKAATMPIPIGFAVRVEPLALGSVASLSRPGGNITGVSLMNVELGPKRLEFLHELVPAASTIALLLNPTGPDAESFSRDVRAAAESLRVQLPVLLASTEGEI